jgi:HNH/ENDO VII superfamily nuclease with conserved GHE residues
VELYNYTIKPIYQLATDEKSIQDFMTPSASPAQIINGIKDYYDVTTPEGAGHLTGTIILTAAMIAIGAASASSGAEAATSDAADAGETLHRPYLRVSTIDAIKANSETIDGDFVDANSHEVIEGDYQIGHKYGYEFYKFKEWAENINMSQADFNDYMNNPDFYQIEDPLSNMSHAYEAPADIFYGGN